METSTKDRLVQFLASISMGQGSFEKYVGLSNGFVNNGGDSIRKKSLDKISLKYPEYRGFLQALAKCLTRRAIQSQRLACRKVSLI